MSTQHKDVSLSLSLSLSTTPSTVDTEHALSVEGVGAGALGLLERQAHHTTWEEVMKVEKLKLEMGY